MANILVRLMRVVLNASLLVGFVCSFALSAQAEPVELLHILRPRTDIRIKIETILNAKDSVDMMTYHHDSSASSFLLMEAMRLAAQRGVKVRYIYDKVATDRHSDFSPGYLDLLRESGVEVRALTVMDRLKGWGPFKHLHSKLLIADSGSDKEVVIFGGRNQGDRYLAWLDNSYLLRYARGSHLAHEVRRYYDSVWKELTKPKSSNKPLGDEIVFANEDALRVSLDQRYSDIGINEEVRDFRTFMENAKANLIPRFVLDSSQIDFVTSSLVQKVKYQEGDNEIDQVFKMMLKRSKTLEMSTIFFGLADETRGRFKNFLARGGELTILTNNADSFPSVLDGKDGIRSRALTKLQNQEFAELSKFGKIHGYEFTTGSYNFNHTKFIIGDNEVLLSSTNKNYSSDVNGEDSGFHILSKEFADYMKLYSSQVKSRFFTPAEYKDGERLTFAERVCSRVLLNVF